MDKQHLRWFVRHVALVVMLLTALLVAVGPHGGLAQDPDDPDAQSEPPTTPEDPEAELNAAAGPHFLPIPAGAFSSDGTYPDRPKWSITGGYFYGSNDVGGCVKAPVYPPIGATINGLQVFVDDQRTDQSEWFKLYRISLANGGVNQMASVESPYEATSGVARLSDYSINYPLVTESYVYQVFTCTRINIFVYGVRILYATGAGSAAADEEVDLPIVMDGE